MTELERVGVEFLASLVAYDCAARSSPIVEPVFPPDVDFEVELSERLAEIRE